ncbi:glutathione S-transferase family protein [Gilvimarinus sp. SDUM040013]|uniref:Glutathione S-transferase family protein n=1 Tax=Gilvimarinus gilvus TaxID=3058038 RepID=A0ABU4RZY0_9GAMM|nr:glutathione S-transferase family protein [Gilvimarinus sp. SDUM040013]MDO3386189.1 glutathione S-transferase family protein [Gilvimarinus sp. SDUM040013]MDX6849816.1 glutathione S-transferase family protein [Gilvimarinus sp. SDUM040013]
MGLLVDGQWQDRWYDTQKTGGKFVRQEATFRHWITADGSAGPSGEGGFKAEKGRYHLYVSYACPWAHRTLIFRALKGLIDWIDVSVVNPIMLENGWTFEPGDKVIPDPIHHADFLHQVYTADTADFTGRVTVPLLWDKQSGRIVSNESADIIRMFNSAFDTQGAAAGDYYPTEHKQIIDEINERVYNTVNNGVYRCGFATTQQAYAEAVNELFDSLDWLEGILSRQRYLAGDKITEADWRLFTTLIRFDAVYHGHFKCNLQQLKDYPNLSAYVRELYQWPGVADTVHFDHIKSHYYRSHKTINPTGIVPEGPLLDFNAPHGRS